VLYIRHPLFTVHPAPQVSSAQRRLRNRFRPVRGYRQTCGWRPSRSTTAAAMGIVLAHSAMASLAIVRLNPGSHHPELWAARRRTQTRRNLFQDVGDRLRLALISESSARRSLALPANMLDPGAAR